MGFIEILISIEKQTNIISKPFSLDLYRLYHVGWGLWGSNAQAAFWASEGTGAEPTERRGTTQVWEPLPGAEC